jgi:hypothetical protein
MKLHHIALRIPDIAPVVKWRVKTRNFDTVHQDQTLTLLDTENMSIVLVLRSKHLPNVVFKSLEAEKYGDLTTHRGGSESVCVQDPFRNTVEFLEPAVVRALQ